VGNSGGNPESGLYFEVRYQSRPVDPLQWVGQKAEHKVEHRAGKRPSRR